MPRRILAAVLFLPLLVLLARTGGIAFFLLIELVVLFGLREFYHVAGRSGLAPRAGLGIVGGLGLVAGMGSPSGAETAIAVLVFLLGGGLVLEVSRPRAGNACANVGTVLFGVLFVAGTLGHLVLLRGLQPGSAGAEGEEAGAGFALLPFLLAWSGDTGAYFIGRRWGRHALHPRVSPGKTWEGWLGGAACTMAAALWVGLRWPVLGVADCLVLGAVAAVLGPLGDLAESLLKREGGVKDASRLIPGHGGVLDRFDSLLFVAPAVYYLLRFVIRP